MAKISINLGFFSKVESLSFVFNAFSLLGFDSNDAATHTTSAASVRDLFYVDQLQFF